MLVTAAAVVALFVLMLAVTLALVLFAFFVVMTAAALVLREGVVVLGAFHTGGGKTVSELDAADSGNGKDGVRNLAFHAIPEGFSQADGQSAHLAFHHAAQGIAFGLRGFQGLRPGRRICEAAYFRKFGVELGEIHHFLGNHTGCYHGQGEPAAEMTAAAGVVEATEFEVGREVGLAGTGVLAELLVVLRAGVLVLEEDGERGAGGLSLVDAAHNFGLIGLDAGRSARGAGLAAGQILGEICFTERNAGEHAVQGNTDTRAVRLAENAYSEFITEGIHI